MVNGVFALAPIVAPSTPGVRRTVLVAVQATALERLVADLLRHSGRRLHEDLAVLLVERVDSGAPAPA